MNGATLDARGRINVVGNAAGMQFNSNGNVTVAGDISVLAVTRTASFDRNNSSQFSFNGNVTVRGGRGNDRLELGRSVADGGDGFSRASFGAGSSVDGGANLNSFDDELSQTVGDPTILNWTDPTAPATRWVGPRLMVSPRSLIVCRCCR